MSRKIKGSILVIAIMLIFSLTACSNEKVVAKVEDVKITQDEFYDRLLQVSGNEVLETLIAEVLVDLESEKLNIEISQDQIDEELESLAGYYGGEDGLKNAMETSNTSMDVLEGQITNNLKVQELVKPYINISDEDVERYFESNKNVFNLPDQIGARHILVDTEEEADEIHGKILAGEDFEDLANEFSKDSNGEDGGDLGLFGRGEMVAEFEEAAFDLEVGQVSQPVESSFGFHIIRVDEINEAKDATLEEFEDDIRDILSGQQMQTAYNNWYMEKSAEYDRVNYLPLHEGQN